MTHQTVENLLADFVVELEKPNIDLSNLIANIHVLAMQLELHEPGLWWDVEQNRLFLRHINVINWMAHYGFSKMSELPTGAVAKLEDSLKTRLQLIEKSLPAAELDQVVQQ